MAVVGALAALNPHDVLVEVLSVGALEAQADGAGQRRGAAASVHTRPTGAWPITLSRGASGKRQANQILGAARSLALLSFLDRGGRLVTGPDLAESGLSQRLTLRVMVGDSRGQAHPTGHGALTPLGRLRETPGLHHYLRHGEGQHLFVSLPSGQPQRGLVLPQWTDVVGQGQLVRQSG